MEMSGKTVEKIQNVLMTGQLVIAAPMPITAELIYPMRVFFSSCIRGERSPLTEARTMCLTMSQVHVVEWEGSAVRRH